MVIGVSSFSYLHNRRKVDFYHNIPVRRAFILRAVHGRIFHRGVRHLLNLVFVVAVGGAYGVGFAGILDRPSLAGDLICCFFLLIYAVVAVAMIMTGNMLVGILGSGVFFFFYIPAMVSLIVGYFNTFLRRCTPIS